MSVSSPRVSPTRTVRGGSLASWQTAKPLPPRITVPSRRTVGGAGAGVATRDTVLVTNGSGRRRRPGLNGSLASVRALAFAGTIASRAAPASTRGPAWLDDVTGGSGATH